MSSNTLTKGRVSGRIAVPMLLWIAGVPFTVVLLVWLIFFRGH